MFGYGPDTFSYPTFLGILYDGMLYLDTKNLTIANSSNLLQTFTFQLLDLNKFIITNYNSSTGEKL